MALFPPIPAGALFIQNGAGSPVTGTTAAGTNKLLSQQGVTYPLPSLDQGYFQAMSGVNKAVRLVARGLISFVSAASVQTLVTGFYFATTDTTTMGTALAATGTITPGASAAVTNAVWEMEADINLLTAGSSGTMQGLGLFTIAPTAVTTPTGASDPTAGAVTVGMGGSAAVTYNTEAAGFIQVGATWGASNSSASNTLTCYQVFAIALN